MTKFLIRTSSGGQHAVWCANKREANKLAKQAERLAGMKVVSVERAQ